MEAISWIILTQGTRSAALDAAVGSVAGEVVVVANTAESVEVPCPRNGRVVEPGGNLGVPAGRDFGVRGGSAEIIGFLDDDAVGESGVTELVVSAFNDEPALGAVALRLVDEHASTARRHVPRLGGRRPDQGGEVALFLGGACAIRRTAYLDAGGYWGELFYGHEEVELAWRLIDRGWSIRYLPEARVFHPRTEIGRHAEGWFMTGRNRVMIARRTLPWPIAGVHVSAWLLLGTVRAPGSENRCAYLRGWWKGWSMDVEHEPIRWRTVWRLTRLGRPPVL